MSEKCKIKKKQSTRLDFYTQCNSDTAYLQDWIMKNTVIICHKGWLLKNLL